jgi:hypothetical protein
MGILKNSGYCGFLNVMSWAVFRLICGTFENILKTYDVILKASCAPANRGMTSSRPMNDVEEQDHASRCWQGVKKL